MSTEEVHGTWVLAGGAVAGRAMDGPSLALPVSADG